MPNKYTIFNSMFKYPLLVMAILMFRISGSSQNLVPNPSFEIYSQCPNSDNQIDRAVPWMDVTPTSDYYNCNYEAESQCPHGRTGNGYAGVSVYRPSWSVPYREYIGTFLTSPLIAGTEYYCEFWVKLECDKCWASDALGAWFTNGIPPDPPGVQMLFNTVPQILNQQYRMLDQRSDWMKICGTFVANGGENFITIGSFKDDNYSTFVQLSGCPYQNYGVHWSYYLIDDVELVQYDTTMVVDCIDSAYSNPNPGGGNGTPVTPYPDYSIDHECDIWIPNTLSPNADGLNDAFFISTDTLEYWSIFIYNRWGETVFSGNSKIISGWNGKNDKGEPLVQGTYFYLILSPNEKCYKKGIITLFE